MHPTLIAGTAARAGGYTYTRGALGARMGRISRAPALFLLLQAEAAGHSLFKTKKNVGRVRVDVGRIGGIVVLCVLGLQDQL